MEYFSGDAQSVQAKTRALLCALVTNNFLKLLAHRLGDIARLQQLCLVSMAVG